ncbi:unnamed protein product [Calypogeia fissa]
MAFQRQVRERSISWTTFCPVIVRSEDPFAYDKASRTWQRLPTLSCLPKFLLRAYLFTKKTVQIEGPLLFIPATTKLFVVNLLNRSWKELPPHPVSIPWQECERHAKLVMSPGAEGETSHYKVIILSCGKGDLHPLQIYDSRSATWKKIDLPQGFYRNCAWTHGSDIPMSPAAYLNGVLYIVRPRVAEYNGSLQILVVNLEEETMDELHIPLEDRRDRISTYLGGYLSPLVWNANLLVINSTHEPGGLYLYFHGFKVKKVDLRSRIMAEVSRGPPFTLGVSAIQDPRPVSYGDFVLFWKDGRSRVLAYNMVDGEWGFFPFLQTANPTAAEYQIPSVDHWIGSSFSAGVDPFVV